VERRKTYQIVEISGTFRFVFLTLQCNLSCPGQGELNNRWRLSLVGAVSARPKFTSVECNVIGIHVHDTRKGDIVRG